MVSGQSHHDTGLSVKNYIKFKKSIDILANKTTLIALFFSQGARMSQIAAHLPSAPLDVNWILGFVPFEYLSYKLRAISQRSEIFLDGHIGRR